jgi:hypothetical protein
MARKTTTAMMNRAAKMYERAKLQQKIDEWRAKEITSTTSVKRAQARMERIKYQGMKDALRVRRGNKRT